MKKTLLGLGLILLAAYVLFKDYLALPDLGLPLWTLIFILIFGFSALQSLLQRSYLSAYICGVITFLILENQFDWLRIGTGTIILAAILLGLGLSLIFKPQNHHFRVSVKGFGEDDVIEWDARESTESDTVFGNATRYIKDDPFTDIGGDVVFSGSTIYFDNARMLGDRASFSGDAVFSNVKLYVPSNWQVDFAGDRVFSSIKTQPSGLATDKTLTITGDYVFSSLEIIYI